jgi:uncharacterized membrane protein YphA (DoxX/SURF4 family)
MVWIEIITRWLFGLQFPFWGLNGFFHWKAIPPSGEVIDSFVQACIKTRFIMPVVKWLEIISGILLLVGLCIPLALAMLAPLLFVITFLHVLHNPRWWEVIVPVCLPYTILLFFHGSTFKFLLEK